MKYPPAPLTPFSATLPQSPALPSRSHSLISRTAQALSVCTTIACSLLKSLGSLFASPVLCFQWLAASFHKTPGGGGYPLPIPAIHPSGSPHRANPCASYHIPATLAVSCDYALFRSTAASQTLSRQEVTHSFHRNRGGTPRVPQDSASTVSPARGSCYLR